MALCLTVLSFVAVGTYSCSDEADPLPPPPSQFPMYLYPPMDGTRWENAQIYPTGATYTLGVDSAGTELQIMIDARTITLDFKDSTRIEIINKVFRNDTLMDTKINNWYYIYNRYENKGVMSATQAGGLQEPFNIMPPDTANKIHLHTSSLGPDFEKK